MLPTLDIEDKSGMLHFLHSFMEDSRLSGIFGLDLSAFYLEVVAVDSQSMQEINFAHRGKNSSTDVLSFPLVYDFNLMQEDDIQPFENMPKFCLGSVVINVEIAQEMADKLGHSVQDELGLLFIHGFLHIMGYDHERDNGAQRAMEEKIIHILQLPQSLIERAEKCD